MEVLVTALVFGLACAADGCLLGAALAAVLLDRSPVQWAICIGVGHALLMTLGVFLTGALGSVSGTAAAALTLAGSSVLLLHLLNTAPRGRETQSCCSCSAHKPHRRPPTVGLLADLLAAVAMSGDALIGGIAFRGLFPTPPVQTLVAACVLSGLVTGVLVYCAVRGVKWTLLRVFGPGLQTACLVTVCGVLGVVWLSSLAEFVGGTIGVEADAFQPGLGIIGGAAGALLLTFTRRREAVARSLAISSAGAL